MFFTRRGISRWSPALAYVLLVALLAVTSSAAGATGHEDSAARDLQRAVNTENNMYAVTRSYCGQVYAIVLLRDPAAEPNSSRLPITVFVSEPTRGLARTQVLLLNPGSPLLTVQTPTQSVLSAAPTGRAAMRPFPGRRRRRRAARAARPASCRGWSSTRRASRGSASRAG